MKLRVALLVAGIGAMLVPAVAQADHCSSNVVIFSGLSGVQKVNSNAAACLADSAHDTPYDGRIINPGSNEIYVRYIVGCAAGDQIDATLVGLGHDATIILTCSPSATGTLSYNSAVLPLDNTLTGCITATVNDPDAEGTNTTTFHTVGATC